jgi:hypothetical protein
MSTQTINVNEIQKMANEVKQITNDVQKMASIEEVPKPKMAEIEDKELGLILNTLIVCSQRGTFKLEEYKPVGELFERLKEKIPPENTQKTETNDKPKNKILVTDADLTLSISVLTICSQRAAFKLEEYKPIGELFEHFKKSLEQISSPQ